MRRIYLFLLMLIVGVGSSWADVSFDSSKSYYIIEKVTGHYAAFGVTGAEGAMGLKSSGKGDWFKFTKGDDGRYTITTTDGKTLGVSGWNTANSSQTWAITETTIDDATYYRFEQNTYTGGNGGYLNYQSGHETSLYTDANTSGNINFSVVETDLWKAPEFGGTDWTWNGTTFDATDQTSTATPGRLNSKGAHMILNNAGTVSVSAGGDTSDKGGVTITGSSSNVTCNLKDWAGSIEVGTAAIATVSYGLQLKNTESTSCANVWTDGELNFATSRTNLNVNDGNTYQNWYIGENGKITSAFTSVTKGTKTWNLQVVVTDEAKESGYTYQEKTLTKQVLTWGADLSSNINSIEVWYKDSDGKLTKLENSAVSYDAEGITITYTGKGNIKTYTYTVACETTGGSLTYDSKTYSNGESFTSTDVLKPSAFTAKYLIGRTSTITVTDGENDAKTVTLTYSNNVMTTKANALKSAGLITADALTQYKTDIAAKTTAAEERAIFDALCKTLEGKTYTVSSKYRGSGTAHYISMNSQTEIGKSSSVTPKALFQLKYLSSSETAGQFNVYNYYYNGYWAKMSTRNGRIPGAVEANAAPYEIGWSQWANSYSDQTVLKNPTSTTGEYYVHESTEDYVVDWRDTEGAEASKWTIAEATLTTYTVSVTYSTTGVTGGALIFGAYTIENGGTITTTGLTTDLLSAPKIENYKSVITIGEDNTITVAYTAAYIKNVSPRILASTLDDKSSYVMKSVGGRVGYYYKGQVTSDGDKALYGNTVTDLTNVSTDAYIFKVVNTSDGKFKIKFGDDYLKSDGYSFSSSSDDAAEFQLVAKSGCDAGVWNIKTPDSYLNMNKTEEEGKIATIPVTSEYKGTTWNDVDDTNGKWEIYRVNYDATEGDLYYALTDVAGTTYTGSYTGVKDVTYPTLTGVEGYTLSDYTWTTADSKTTLNATITFPFTVSSATTKNYVYLNSEALTSGNPYFKVTDGTVKTRATGQYTDGTYLPTNQSGENEKWEWAIIPTLTSGKFTFKIYSATGKYVEGTAEASSVSLGDTGADFCYGATNINSGKGFYLADATGVFFAANSTSEGEQDAILWTKSGTSHKGANLVFSTPANFTTLVIGLNTAYTAVKDYPIGTGVGKYTATDDFSTAKTQAAAIVSETSYATAANITTYTNTLTNKTGLTINQPVKNTYYRFKSARNRYICSNTVNKSSDDQNLFSMTTTDAEGYDAATTPFCFNDNANFQSYKTGKVAAWGWKADDGTSSHVGTWTIEEGSVMSTYTIKCLTTQTWSNQIYLGDNNSSYVNRQASADEYCNWTIEEIESLPVITDPESTADAPVIKGNVTSANDVTSLITSSATSIDMSEATTTATIDKTFMEAITTKSGNANTMLIVSTDASVATETDTKPNNVIVKGDDENTCADLVLTDGFGKFVAPVDFTATNASYTRGSSSTLKWGTICLPYAPTSTDVTYYELKSQTEEGGTAKLVFSAVANPVANTPYLYKNTKAATTGGADYAATATSAEVTIPTGQMKGGDASYYMVGVYAPSSISDGTSEGYTGAAENYPNLITDANALYIKSGSFWKINKRFTLKPFRAYITSTTSEARFSNMIISIDDDDTTTGVQFIESEDGKTVDVIYDVNGARLQQMKNGINIVNGKKVIK